jgi:hypothetical protein
MLILCVPPAIATVPYMYGTGTLIVAGLQSFLTDPIVNLFSNTDPDPCSAQNLKPDVKTKSLSMNLIFLEINEMNFLYFLPFSRHAVR